MIKIIIKSFAILCLLVLSGCASNKAWQYTSDTYSGNRILIEKKVAVPPFVDSRINDNSNKVGRIQLRSAILVVMRPSAKILQKRLNEVFYS